MPIVMQEEKVVVAPTSTLEEAGEFAIQNGVAVIYLSIPPYLREELKDNTTWPIIVTREYPQTIE
jgi:hypothetical protein